MNMYIGNLNYRVKEEDLGQFLSAYGTVSSVKIIRDRETGKSKGYGFVEMDDQSAAKILDERNRICRKTIGFKTCSNKIE